MGKNYSVSTRINRGVEEVFDAVVSSERLCRYFSGRSSADLIAGQRVTWSWKDWGDFPVEVRTVEANRRIELVLDSMAWQKTTDEGYEVRVVFDFEATDDGGTMVTVSESGWRTDAEGLKASHDNCGGWMHMLTCLKASLEHDIDLR